MVTGPAHRCARFFSTWRGGLRHDGLDRFSEDLDFSLLGADLIFRFDPYFDTIGRELTALGLQDYPCQVRGRYRPAGRRISLDLGYLQSRLTASGAWSGGAMTASDARTLLHRKIDTLDIEAAREDVSRFIPVPADLDLWSREFFNQIAETVQGA